MGKGLRCFTNEITSIDVLYSVNAKKEPAGSSKSPKVSTLSTGSKISISDLLDFVNKYYPDILPEDVLKHYGYDSRPEGKLGESALFSLKESVEETKDLIAVHNLFEEKLLKSLNLGGLPMPSIAVKSLDLSRLFAFIE